MGWSIRRELWENRSIYLAPLVVAGLFLVGFLVPLVRLPETIRAAAALDPMRQQEAIQQPYVVVAIMLMGIALIVAIVYCLDALYGERRDRSILFWKSMPVSDLATVLAKASIPVLVLPLVAFVLTVATQLIMLLLSSAVLAATGSDVGLLWARMPFLEASGVHFLHLVGTHGLGWAPLYAWLILVSAWARRAPILWAVLPPVAIGAVERVAFGTTRFADFLRDYFLGGPVPEGPSGPMTMDMLTPQSVGGLVTDPGFWLGLAVAALFLLAAVRLRRSRGPI
jgi:ABC-2 type transport system permease protein